MNDWEAEDFDCMEQVTDKIVALGLGSTLKMEKNSQQKDGELSEKQKLELQMKSDADIGLDLLGIETTNAESWNSMRRMDDFTDYAEKLAESISSHANHSHYLTFVNSLVKHICMPMTKIQLETVLETIQKLINSENKKIEELKKKELEKITKEKTKKKKKINKLLEDHVEDEYDDFDEKFN